MKCLYCLEEFKPNRTWQRFCKMQCRNDFHNKRVEKKETEPDWNLDNLLGLEETEEEV